MASNLKTIHSLMMKKLRDLVELKVLLNEEFLVNCTLTNMKNTDVVYENVVGEQAVIINILYEDLQREGAPLRGYKNKNVTVDRVTYVVVDEEYNETYKNTLVLKCKVFGNG